MDATTAVAIAAVAFVLMVGIVFGFAAVALLDAAVVWPPRRRPRHQYTSGPGAQYWARSPQMVITAEYDVYQAGAS